MPKIFLSYDQQIEKLKNEKNLQIDDEAYSKADRLSLHKSCTEKIWKCSVMGTDKCIDIWKYLKNVYAASARYTD